MNRLSAGNNDADVALQPMIKIVQLFSGVPLLCAVNYLFFGLATDCAVDTTASIV
jgi:hypothetical protein